jgi:hypothetical protein
MYIDSHLNILYHPLSSEQQLTMIFKIASLTGLAVLSALSVTVVEAAAAASGDQDKMHGVLKEVVLKGVHSASVRNLQTGKTVTGKNKSPTKSPMSKPTNSPIASLLKMVEFINVLMSSSPWVKNLARMLAMENVARILMVRMLVFLSQGIFAKMKRAAWVIKPAQEEKSNPSPIRATEGRPVNWRMLSAICPMPEMIIMHVTMLRQYAILPTPAIII